MSLFEPYRRDAKAWDGQIIALLTGLLSVRDWRVLLIVAWLVYCIVYVVVLLLIAQQTLRYICRVYRKRAFRNTTTGHILHAALVSVIVAWLVAFVFYDPDSPRTLISYHLHINILTWSFMLYAFTVIGVDIYEERNDPPQGRPQGSNVNHFIQWKSKQTTK